MREIDLDEYEWSVSVYDDVAPNNVQSLKTHILEMGMDEEEAHEALGVFDSPNRGLIYTDPAKRHTLIAIGWATSWKREINTLSHELYHLAEHICKASNMNTDGEPPAYVMSYLVEKFM